MPKPNSEQQKFDSLYQELILLIEQSHRQMVSHANSTLTILFWQVGKRINEEVLHHTRAEYGKQIVPSISIHLEQRFGRNFTEKNVRRMIQFAEQFEDFEIVVPLARQLTWSHILILLPLKSKDAQLYYAKMVHEGQ